MIAWVYLLAAALFESGWIYSLKFLNLKLIMEVKMSALMRDNGAWQVFLPLAGYIIFGVCNIYFFSMAMKNIPASTAFAVWMALALVFSKLLDIFVFKEPYTYQEILFTGVVLIGIVGLKYFSKS